MLSSALARAGEAPLWRLTRVGMISTLLITFYGQVRIFVVMARKIRVAAKTFAKIPPQNTSYLYGGLGSCCGDHCGSVSASFDH